MTYLEDVTDKQVISLRFQQYNLFYSQVLPDLGEIVKKIDVSISQHLTVVGFSANKWDSLFLKSIDRYFLDLKNFLQALRSTQNPDLTNIQK